MLRPLNYVHGHNEGIFVIAHDMEFNDATIISTAANSLNQLHFNGDHTLTINVNDANFDVYAENGLTTENNGQGKIILNRNASFSKIGANDRKYHSIQILNDKTVTFAGASYFSEGVTFGTVNSKAIIKRDFVGNLTTANAGHGSVTFEATSNNLTGNIDNLGNVTVNNGLNVQGNINNLATLAIEGGESVFKVTGEYVMANGNKITSSGNKIHSIDIDGKFDTIGDVGAKNKQLKIIKLSANNSTFNIGKGNIYASVETDINGKNIVNFNGESANLSGSIGKKGYNLQEVNFNNKNASVLGNLYSDKVKALENSSASFTSINGTSFTIPGTKNIYKNYSVISGTDFTTLKDASMKFKGNYVVDTAIIAANDKNGDFAFDGRLVVNKPIGTKDRSINEFSLTKNNVAELYDNIYAKKLNISGAAIKIQNGNRTIKGNIAEAKNYSVGTELNAGINTLTYIGQAYLGKDTKFSIDVGMSADKKEVTAGKFIIDGNGSSINLTDTDDINITVGTVSVIKDWKSFNHTLINPKDGATFVDKTKERWKITNPSPFVTLVFNPANYTLSITEDIEKGVKETIIVTEKVNKETVDKVVNTLIDTKEDSNARQILQLVEELSSIQRSSTSTTEENTKAKDTLANLINRMVPIAQDTTLSTDMIENMLSNIISDMNNPVDIRTNDNIVAVSSGDDETRKRHFGLWAIPFYSKSTLTAESNNVGYAGSAVGVASGFDFLVNERFSVGLSYAYASNSFEYDGVKIGDESAVKSHAFSLYGTYHLPNNFFFKNIASYSMNNINSEETRVLNIDTNERAKATFDTSSLSIQSIIGYQAKPSNVKLTITPFAGVRYTRLNDVQYKETGTTYSNLSVNKKGNNKFEALIGASVAYDSKFNNIILTPEIHANARYAFKNNPIEMEALLDGSAVPLPARLTTNAKLNYNIGAALQVSSGAMEYGIGYDIHLAENYIAHQGHLKLKVNM